MPRRYKFITFGSLIGLFAGFVAGYAVYDGGAAFMDGPMSVLRPIEMFWIDLLRIIVYPLIVSFLVLAVAAAAETKVAGKIGAWALGTHVVLLFIVTAFTVTVGPAILNTDPLSSESVQAFRDHALNSLEMDDTAPNAAALDRAAAQKGLSFLERLYETLLSVNIVIVLIFSVVFALALGRVREGYRDPVLLFFRMLSKYSLYAVEGLLLVMPLVVLVVTYDVVARMGGRFAGTMGFWVILLSSLLLIVTLALYLVSFWAGKVSPGRFARAMLPVQILAFASRSSLVCLPKLLEAANKGLALPERVTGIVLPLSVSSFKLNRMVSTPMNMFFLTYLYGIELDPALAASLVFTAMILSFAIPGIPSGGKFTTLPIYLAAGVPVEGVILLKAVDAIPDIFKTLINVTEDLTLTTVVARFAGPE